MHLKPGLLTVFVALGSLLVALVSITVGNMFLEQAKDLSGLFNVLRDAAVLDAIFVSVSATTSSTLISLLLGVPLAYVLARHSFLGSSVIEGIMDVPMMIPHIVAGIALYEVFMQSGLVGSVFNALHIGFRDTFLGVVLAMLFMSFPFLVNTTKEGFKSIDPRLENVSRSLGISQWRTFQRVTLPLSCRFILSGVVQCWARGISEFTAVLVLAYFPKSAPILIYEKFTIYGISASRPISVLLIVICAGVFALLRVLRGRKR